MSKLKNITLIITIIITFSLLITCASATDYPSHHLKITLLSQDPDPVEPGQIVKVKFKVENEGAQTTQDVILKLLPKFPFTLYGDFAEKNIGKLKAVATGADAATVEFSIKVDEKAVEEDTELELVAQTGDGGISYTNNEFLINIQTHDAVLAITSITSEPSPIAPGSTAKVTILVKNTADSLLKDIKFKLDMSGSSTPVAPYQSSSEKIIPLLQTNYQQTLTFSLIAKPDAASGLYKVPLNITYKDEMGTTYSYNDVLAVLLGEKPKVNLYVKKSTVMQENTAGKITLEAANSGNTDLKYLELTLLPSNDYKLITTRNYFYLGNLASDDTQSEEIEIYINGLKEVNGEKKAHLTGQLKYVDANNQNFQQAFDLELNVYSSSQLKKFGVLQSSNSWVYILIIILAVGGFFAYKKYWKKNNGNNKK